MIDTRPELNAGHHDAAVPGRGLCKFYANFNENYENWTIGTIEL